MENYERARNQSIRSVYALWHRTSFLDKLRHNENVEIRSLDILCSILKCDFGDIVEHIPDETESKEQ